MEDWKTIRDFSKYQVSNYGRVRSMGGSTIGLRPSIAKTVRKNKILKPQHHKQGYELVTLYSGHGEHTIFTVHSLVAEYFIGHRPEGLVINHKDNNPTHNNVENLEYCTQYDNINAINPRKQPVVQLDMYDNIIGIFDTMTIASKGGFSVCGISQCCKGLIPTHKGFIFRYY